MATGVFGNTAGFFIFSDPNETPTPAGRYASRATAFDLDGPIREVRVTLYGFTHKFPEDVDILLDVPISVWEALLGTKVEVPTLDGTRVTVTIPPGTSSHAKLRIKGRGIERGEEKGDQFCVIRIVVPKNIAEDDKATIKELASKYPIDARADVPWK